MDWITGIRNAINYIEDLLTEKIDHKQVARESFSLLTIFGPDLASDLIISTSICPYLVF